MRVNSWIDWRFVVGCTVSQALATEPQPLSRPRRQLRPRRSAAPSAGEAERTRRPPRRR